MWISHWKLNTGYDEYVEKGCGFSVDGSPRKNMENSKFNWYSLATGEERKNPTSWWVLENAHKRKFTRGIALWAEGMGETLIFWHDRWNSWNCIYNPNIHTYNHFRDMQNPPWSVHRQWIRFELFFHHIHNKKCFSRGMKMCGREWIPHVGIVQNGHHPSTIFSRVAKIPHFGGDTLKWYVRTFPLSMAIAGSSPTNCRNLLELCNRSANSIPNP